MIEVSRRFNTGSLTAFQAGKYLSIKLTGASGPNSSAIQRSTSRVPEIPPALPGGESAVRVVDALLVELEWADLPVHLAQGGLVGFHVMRHLEVRSAFLLSAYLASGR